ncbi:sensory histidine kinase AtoS [compost metagenome]
MPIQIHLAHTNQEVSIRVSDTGGGLKNHDRSRTIFDYFYSTAPRFEPTYTYSGNFGAPFTGLGCGLPIARQYARFYGGDLRVATLPGYGTDVYLHLNRNGITHEEVH